MISNKERYCIVGNNIVLETLSTEIIANSSLSTLLFAPQANRRSIVSKQTPFPVTSLNSASIHYYNSGSLLHKATNLGSTISFKAGAELMSNSWTPLFHTSDKDTIYNWKIKASTPRATFVLVETYYKSTPFMLIDSARLIYAEQDSENAGIVHTFAPPFPNTYENANLCLGTLKEGDSVPLDLNNPIASSAKLMENGWNADLYRHAVGNFTGPTEDLSFNYHVKRELQKSTTRNHRFFRLTDQTDTDIVTGLLNPEILT